MLAQGEQAADGDVGSTSLLMCSCCSYSLGFSPSVNIAIPDSVKCFEICKWNMQCSLIAVYMAVKQVCHCQRRNKSVFI